MDAAGWIGLGGVTFFWGFGVAFFVVMVQIGGKCWQCKGRNVTMSADFFAHSLEGRPETDWEPLEAHLEETARYACLFLGRIHSDLAIWGELVGRWHDLGKYLDEFREKLRGKAVSVDHAGVGAAYACEQFKSLGLALAFAIAGHHTGLANLAANDRDDLLHVSRTPLKVRLGDNMTALRQVAGRLPDSVTQKQTLELPQWLVAMTPGDEANRSFVFFVRLLFSALVDADRLATGDFYARAEGKEPEHVSLQYEPLNVLRDRLDAHIDGLAGDAAAEHLSAVNKLRAEVLAACRRAARIRPGLFSLTVPTGGSKTFSAMSFSLGHAVEYGLDRVIVVIPYTSIIEQNAARYREAFGIDGVPDERNVLEHHSGIDEQKAEEINAEAEMRRRLAAENWDAPIVVTTAVQFFESLFTDHPSRGRKLHRIAKSVVILDEVQTLPPRLLLPILEGLKELVAHYGVSVVLSTATPPALVERPGLPKGLREVRPIIADPVALSRSRAARRVRVEWRMDRVTPYEELAFELGSLNQVLAVVHRRQDARVLAEMLPAEGRFHLSALMCPAHRLKRIDEITRALREGRTCRVVSTQLIEAGVDIDLPVVYRALAGLDSLAQAAGRCDREGRLTEAAGEPGGRFVVFRAESSPPAGTLRKALQSVEKLWELQGRISQLPDELDPFNPEHCELFFSELYGKEELDSKRVLGEAAKLNFANVAAAFQMIEDGWSRPVVVPWGAGAERIEAYQRDASRKTARALQPFMVQISDWHLAPLLESGAVERWAETNLHLPTGLFGKRYSDEFGLIVEPDCAVDPELLMV